MIIIYHRIHVIHVMELTCTRIRRYGSSFCSLELDTLHVVIITCTHSPCLGIIFRRSIAYIVVLKTLMIDGYCPRYNVISNRCW
jgi:hypothetical protein